MSYSPLTQEDQVVSSDVVVSATWTDNVYTLDSFFTSSVQTIGSTGKFYTDVYQTGSSLDNAEVQFQVAWGDSRGSGSAYFNSLAPDYTPTRDIYGQYRALILGDENASFTFDAVTGSKQIGVISLERSRYKQSFNPGSLTLKLGNGTDELSLTDNSQVQTTATFINNTQYYTLISGSQGNPGNNSVLPTDSGSYGYVFPNLGTIILNPNALALPSGNGGLGITWDESSTSGSFTNPQNPNNEILFDAISNGSGFSLQSSEVISANYIFCRARNAENNYTANPTIIDNDGNLIYNQLINSPITYITTVGLYNESNELLAVAKLSKPLQKDFTKEALVRVKMDF